MTTLATVSAGAGADTVINQNTEALSAAAMYGRRAPATAGLTWAYYGGRGFGNTVADGTVTLTASTTNYVVANRTTGAVTVSTSTTNWNDAANYYRVRLLVTGASSVTADTDYREFGGGASSGGSSAWSSLTGVPAPIIDIAALVDPNADRLLFWDDSAGIYTHLTLGTNLSITGTTINASGGGGGLTAFTESLNTASPNNVTNSSRLLASGGTTNQDAVISVKGQGALLAQLPDATATGGNKRGVWAVDWQMNRSVATRVASGATSTIGGGSENTASASNSTVAGGSANTASGLQSTIAGGATNTASGQQSTVGGGTTNTATGIGSTVPGGGNCQASGDYSRAGGNGARAHGITGADVYGAFGNNAIQRGSYVMGRQTNSVTPAVLTADGAAPASANQLVLQNTSTWTFQGTASAQSSGGADKAGWVFQGVVTRVANAASTALVATVTPTLVASAGAGSGWTLAVGVDTTLGALTFTVTGTALLIRWSAEIRTSEVIYG